MMIFPPTQVVENVLFDPRWVSGTKRAESRTIHVGAATSSTIGVYSIGIATQAEMREAPRVKSATATAPGVMTRYTIALTLLCVMGVMLLGNWLTGSPALLVMGMTLGGVGCFVGASAKKRSLLGQEE